MLLGFGAVFSHLCCWLSVPSPPGRQPLPGATGYVDLGGEREPLFCQTEEVSFNCTKEPGKAREPTWEPRSSDW
jgi:hypothetical protein